MTNPKKVHKLDVFRVLENANTKDVNFYNTLTDEEKRAFHPLVVMRWLSGTQDARQVYLMNEFLNPVIFSLAKHKELLYQLMTICNSGNAKRYTWTKNRSSSVSKFPESVKVIQEIFNYNVKHSMEALSVLTNSDIVEYAEYLGRQPPEISKIKKELKRR